MPGQNVIAIKNISDSLKMATQIRPFLEMGLQKLANKKVFIPIGSLIQKSLPYGAWLEHGAPLDRRGRDAPLTEALTPKRQ